MSKLVVYRLPEKEIGLLRYALYKLYFRRTLHMATGNFPRSNNKLTITVLVRPEATTNLPLYYLCTTAVGFAILLKLIACRKLKKRFQFIGILAARRAARAGIGVKRETVIYETSTLG